MQLRRDYLLLFTTKQIGGCGLLLGLLTLYGCRRHAFPDIPEGYREYAYITNTAANTISILDLVYLRPDRTLQVGQDPTGLAVNPVRNEIYVVNKQSALPAGSVSIIDARTNQVVATIPVHRLPYAITVDPSGHRAYIANSGSNSISVLDLDKRRAIFTASAGEKPGLARISADGGTLVVTNRGSNSVSIFNVAAPNSLATPLALRATFTNCPGASDAVILPDSTKVFVACADDHQVMALALASPKADMRTDQFLALLDVGQTPTHLALKPDGGEIFVTNFTSDTISEIATTTNEVGGTYPIGTHPSQGVVSRDNGTLWVSNFGADTVSLYSIDDGKLAGSLHTGAAPDALAFSADEHLLLVADAHAGDIAVIRTQGRQGPTLFTMLPAGQSPSAIVTKALTR